MHATCQDNFRSSRSAGFLRSRRGQSLIEYAVLLSVLCLVFLSMSAYMRRSVQSKLFIVENKVNEAMQ